jgi:hypothetical protein
MRRLAAAVVAATLAAALSGCLVTPRFTVTTVVAG